MHYLVTSHDAIAHSSFSGRGGEASMGYDALRHESILHGDVETGSVPHACLPS